MEAAFVSIGLERDAFLYVEDVLPPSIDPNGNGEAAEANVDRADRPRIDDLVKEGQEFVVQVTKDALAGKGPRVTANLSLPGRTLVYLPGVREIGISRRITDEEERERLRQILESLPAGGGFIARTAAHGSSISEFEADRRYLTELADRIFRKADSSSAPAVLHRELDLALRSVRDLVTGDFEVIRVDDEETHSRLSEFLAAVAPPLAYRLELYRGDAPIFQAYGVEAEIESALKSRVPLPSGGSIVIHQTEALVAIDINTGKFVGKTARLEDTIVKTNLDAIPEIVRQIRLRDLGGIIIIDFIDMDERKNRNRVMAALEDELKNDRAPSKILQFNDFGLVAITRKRVKQSLERTLSTTCNICTGTGMVKSPVTVCNDIYIEMRKMQKHLDRGDVMLRVNPEVVKQLKSPGTRWLQEMEEMVGKTILVKSDPSLHPEQFDIH
jgi:ribonuclease G